MRGGEAIGCRARRGGETPRRRTVLRGGVGVSSVQGVRTKALPKLRGKFAFVVFDSLSVRVFAARDISGEYELKFARDEHGTVIVSNFDGASELLPSKGEMSDLPPGCYLYGHRSISPNRFAKTVAEKSSELAAAAAASARFAASIVKPRRSVDRGAFSMNRAIDRHRSR